MEVILLANDVVPGAHVPVAAPGLRQWGIAEGLRSHGLDVTLVVPRHVADRAWTDVPAPTSEDMLVLAAPEIPEFLRSRAPATVVLTNSNQFHHVEEVDGLRLVYDFFAPKVLELVCQEGDHIDWEHLHQLRERKVQALQAADAVIVNGRKKVPYALGWLLQTDRDVTRVPLLTVPMCVPPSAPGTPAATPPLKVGIAGYLQAWSQPGDWLDVVRQAVSDGRIELHLLLPPHWGGEGTIEESAALRRLAASDGVVRHSPKTYGAFVEFLGGLDLVLDLFDWSLEREYAMVTRTVVALAAGRPVVHPPFTEVSPAIADAEAGWLVDVDDHQLAACLDEIFADGDEVRRRAANAQRVAREHFDPARAVTPLAELVRGWAQ